MCGLSLSLFHVCPLSSCRVNKCSCSVPTWSSHCTTALLTRAEGSRAGRSWDEVSHRLWLSQKHICCLRRHHSEESSRIFGLISVEILLVTFPWKYTKTDHVMAALLKTKIFLLLFDWSHLCKCECRSLSVSVQSSVSQLLHPPRYALLHVSSASHGGYN